MLLPDVALFTATAVSMELIAGAFTFMCCRGQLLSASRPEIGGTGKRMRRAKIRKAYGRDWRERGVIYGQYVNNPLSAALFEMAE